MKKSFKFYIICWAVLFALFNLLTFIVPSWPNIEKYTASFFIGYSVTVVAFAGQFVCGWLSFKEENLEKTFYNISLFDLSVKALFVVFIVSVVCMVITPLPYWISAIACSIVLVFNFIAVALAKATVDVVSNTDNKFENATSFIYEMREVSASLYSNTDEEEFKALCKKVADEFKYSDPMSKDELLKIEVDINTCFVEFKDAVNKSDINVAKEKSKEIISLIVDRNNKCKNLK